MVIVYIWSWVVVSYHLSLLYTIFIRYFVITYVIVFRVIAFFLFSTSHPPISTHLFPHIHCPKSRTSRIVIPRNLVAFLLLHSIASTKNSIEYECTVYILKKCVLYTRSLPRDFLGFRTVDIFVDFLPFIWYQHYKILR